MNKEKKGKVASIKDEVCNLADQLEGRERDAESKRWSKQVDPNKIRERNTPTPRECAVRNLMDLMDDAGFDFDMQQRVQDIINYELERRGEDLSRKLHNICDEEARKEVRGE